MESMAVLHYDDPQSLFSTDSKLINFNDALNHPMHSVSSSILNNSPTYTSLEPVYPALSAPISNMQYVGANPSTTHHTIYSYSAPIYTELPPLQSTVYSHLKDEGIGSLSPASSRRSSNNSSPVSTDSPSSNFPTARECARCTSKEDIIWFNGHFLCNKCLQEVVPPAPVNITEEPPTFAMQVNGGKRKRSSTTSRNEMCSNCESTLSTLWRRSTSTGETVCNACGLYEKLHQRARPKSMRKDTIQTRKRKTKSSQSAKVKKSPKKAIKKEPEEAPVEQHQYVPNYSLPNYESIQMKTSHSPLPYVMTDMGNHQPIFLNYRPEFNYRHDIYNPVPPNDIISASSSVSDTSTALQYTSC